MKRCKQCESLVPFGVLACPSCRATFASFENVPPLEGRYAIEDEIGRGAAGVVYRGLDTTLDRPIALKIIEEKRAGGETLDRFHREARALAAVRSPHVVQIYATGSEAGLSYIVMELVLGEDLYAVLSRYRRHEEELPIRRGLSIIRQVSGAMDRIHAAGILHRDVKPENILIEHETARPVLIDFGLSTKLTGGGRPSIGIGTPHYMAPEQVDLGPDTSASPISARSDVYSLACTAFELLTGRPPFDGLEADIVQVMHVKAPVPLTSSVRAELASFDPVFSKALAKDPTARFDSAGEFAAALDRAGAGWLVDAPVSAAPPADSRVADEISGNVRVLVVDDDAAIRSYVARAAKEAFGDRLELQTAASGLEGIGRALLEAPHILLLDYTMPGLDGIETLTRLRELPGCAEARVIVISANTLAEQKWRFGLLGVSEFFEKPVAFRALVASLQRVGRHRSIAVPKSET